MGLIKTLLGATLDGDVEDLDPTGAKRASAEKAMDEAIRLRIDASADAERRKALPPDRRVNTGTGFGEGFVERRGNVPDRRTGGQGFGRRGRPNG